MKVALISLPHECLPGGNRFHTLHGYWKPPKYVLEFWTGGAKIEYTDDTTYEAQKKEVVESCVECIVKFWRENAL